MGTAHFNNYQQHFQATGPYELRCEVLDNFDAAVAAGGKGFIQVTSFNSDAASTLQGGSQLILESNSLQGEGKLISNGNPSVKLLGEHVKKLTEQLQASGGATVTFSGELNNDGLLQAGKQLTVQGPICRSYAPGVIQAQHTLLRGGDHPSGGIRNRGLIDGKTVEVRAFMVNKFGPGQLRGDRVTIGAINMLNNHREEHSGTPHVPIVSARHNLLIKAPITGTGGIITAEKELTIKGSCINGDGKISSNGDLSVKLLGIHPKKLTGQLQAKRSLITLISVPDKEGIVGMAQKIKFGGYHTLLEEKEISQKSYSQKSVGPVEQLTELYCLVDNFCKKFEPTLKSHSLTGPCRVCQHAMQLSLAEMMTHIIYFHQIRYRQFKYFYQYHVRQILRREFPNAPSYHRIVALMPRYALAWAAFFQTLKESCTGVSIVDSTPLAVCDKSMPGRALQTPLSK